MRKLTIVIDAGHGGHDPGAIGKFTKEKDNVLRVALRLKSILEAAGHNVILTRSTDVFLSLSERAAKAGAWGADIFLSLHNNSAVSSASGFETFIFNGSTVSKASVTLQKAVHTAIANKIGIHDRGMKRGNFAVLRETTMPAVLIEYAFISHKDDEQMLINKVEQMAQWTANGIVAYAGGSVKPAAKPTPQPTPPQKEETNLYKPSASAIVNSTATVLRRLEQKADNPLDPQWREKLLKGELTDSDAIGLLYVAIDRGHIVGNPVENSKVK